MFGGGSGSSLQSSNVKSVKLSQLTVIRLGVRIAWGWGMGGGGNPLLASFRVSDWTIPATVAVPGIIPRLAGF